MIERTRLARTAGSANPEEFLRAEYLSMVEEKMSHAQARLRMRDQGHSSAGRSPSEKPSAVVTAGSATVSKAFCRIRA